MHSELLLGGQVGMFPFHILALSLWFAMVNPSFISPDDPFQEEVTFSTTVIQKPLADVRTFLFVQFCDSLWDPSCTDLWKVSLLCITS
jgi:hypothetical protein